jgi:outer membrane protein
MERTTIVMAALALTMSMSAQKKWTLNECLDYAKQNNITLQKARLKKQQAEEDVKGNKAALLPQLSASANQTVGYKPWQENGAVTVTNSQLNTKVEKSYYSGSYGLNANWTVWNGNRNRNSVKQSAISRDQAELDIETTSNSIQEQIAKYYVQILYLKEAVKVSQQSLETSKKNEERGQQMLEVGKMSKADVAQLSAQRASDEYAIVEAQTNIARYILQLKQLLELNGETAFDIEDSDVYADETALAPVPALQNVYRQALAHRPEIKSSELAVKSSDLSISVARASMLPTVGLSAGVGTGTSSRADNGWGEQMKTNVDASLGLSVTIPIFDQRSARTATRKAKLQRQEALLDMQDKQKELYQTIEEYWLDAMNNQQKLRSAIATEQSEQTSFDLLQEQFRLGLKNIVELMTGKDRLLSAQQNHLQSKYQALLALQMLKFYSGE